MGKVDLITGFLGSGKTTFIKKYARYLMEQGQNIGILENDFGAINVDMMLLRELEGENCELEMVAGGCDKDCYRRRFKTKLIAMGMCGYDTVVDARLEKTLSKEADYVLALEVANAGCVLLSKTQDASAEEIRQTVAHLNRALQEIHCSRVLKDEVICKDWEDFTEKEFKKILESGYLVEDYEKLYVDQDEIFQTLFFMDEKIDVSKAKHAAKKIFEDPACGGVLRIKGFLQDGENWLELNATQHEISLKPIGAGQDVLIIIGEKLNEEKIRYYLE